MDLNPTILIITLNINGLNPNEKTEIVQFDFKSQIQLYVAYKTLILNRKIQIGQSRRMLLV